MTALQVGQSEDAVVRARARWNETGVLLEAGAVYRLEVRGGQHWRDGFVECDAGGYRRWYLACLGWHRRFPRADWFALIGAVDRTGPTQFLIGRGLERFVAPRDGQLTCYANDWPCMYWNNRGQVTLTVKRLA